VASYDLLLCYSFRYCPSDIKQLYIVLILVVTMCSLVNGYICYTEDVLIRSSQSLQAGNALNTTHPIFLEWRSMCFSSVY